MWAKRSKYRNKKVSYAGIKFDSKRELAFYKKLELLQRAGEIKSFKHQVPFTIQDGYINGDGKKIRPIRMVLDFEVSYPDQTVTLFDAKGFMDTEWALKKKIFEKVYYPKTIMEV